MAERRMFSKLIIDSDIFLDMPQTTQNLYFHLCMRADDEGFLNNPKKIMRMVGANQNDIDVLLAKRYLLSFKSGVVVVKHWCMHNAIRKDRLKETVYTEERELIRLKDNNSYTENSENNLGCQSAAECPPRLVEVSIGKVRLDKDRIEESRVDTPSPSKGNVKFSVGVFTHWNNQINTMTHRTHKPDVEGAYKSLLKDKYTEVEILKAIEIYNEALGADECWLNHKWSLKEFLSNAKACRKFIDCGGDYNWLKKNQQGNNMSRADQQTAETEARYGTWPTAQN